LKKYLKNVTLLAYDTRPEEINNIIRVLKKCCEDLDFFEVKLLTDIEPDNLPENIKWEYAPHINHIDDYNLYMFKYLWKHLDTSHCLFVQSDSCILHPELWDDNWLQYDYVGAPWPIIENTYIAWGSKEVVRQGNGGFSLRSKTITQIPYIHDLPLLREQGWANEDGVLNCYYRELMLALGIKYAPIEVAAKFAYENPVPENNYGNMKTFGFHRNRRQNE
jgi:hypothetical protein